MSRLPLLVVHLSPVRSPLAVVVTDLFVSDGGISIFYAFRYVRPAGLGSR
jgi:hypothetical protein